MAGHLRVMLTFASTGGICGVEPQNKPQLLESWELLRIFNP